MGSRAWGIPTGPGCRPNSRCRLIWSPGPMQVRESHATRTHYTWDAGRGRDTRDRSLTITESGTETHARPLCGRREECNHGYTGAYAYTLAFLVRRRICGMNSASTLRTQGSRRDRGTHTRRIRVANEPSPAGTPQARAASERQLSPCTFGVLDVSTPSRGVRNASRLDGNLQRGEDNNGNPAASGVRWPPERERLPRSQFTDIAPMLAA